jgi:AraC-like DNA-binding protein
MAVHFNESTDLSGLDAVIRLKADLLHKLGTSPPSRWTEQVVRFVSALERSDLRDRTALIVLLAELCEEIRVIIGVGEPASPSDVAGFERFALKTWTGLPTASILAQFKDRIVGVLLPAAPPRASLSPIVQRTKSIIDERYAEPLKLRDLATAAGRSKRYLGTLFREEVGMTAHEYLTRVRLRRALDLIRQGEKIEAVSLLVGYRSKANFYHHFKAQIGVTPLVYRAALFHIERGR